MGNSSAQEVGTDSKGIAPRLGHGPKALKSEDRSGRGGPATTLPSNEERAACDTDQKTCIFHLRAMPLSLTPNKNSSLLSDLQTQNYLRVH